MKKFVFILFVSIPLVSCVGDPGRSIILRVTKNNTSVSIYGDSTITPGGHENDWKGVMRAAAPADSSNEMKFHFGMGTWNDPYLIKFSRHIDSIVIVNSNGVEKMADSLIIQDFLIKHRSGLYKNIITIEAK
jgi:hypothetical protein